MSKQLAPLNSFDGGLNTSTNERDIADNEFIAGKNIDSSVVGRLKCVGKWADFFNTATNGDNALESTNTVAGYGLGIHNVDTDTAHASVDGRYIAIFHPDDNNPKVYMYQEPIVGGDKVQADVMALDSTTLGSGNGNATSGSKVDYLSIDGSLTVFSHSDDFAPQKWYYLENNSATYFNCATQIDSSSTADTEIEYNQSSIKGYKQDNQFVQSPLSNQSHVAVSSGSSPGDVSTSLLSDHNYVGLLIHKYDQTSATITGWGDGSATSSQLYHFYASFVYDGNQESLTSEIGTATLGGNSGGSGHNDCSFIGVTRPRASTDSGTIGWNPRITSVRYYYRKADADENILYFIGDYPTKSTETNDFVCKMGTNNKGYAYLAGDSTGKGLNAFSGFGVYHETPPLVFTHSVKSGIRPETKSVECKYRTGVVLNRRLYVGNVKQITKDSPTQEKHYPDRLLKSINNRFDVLPDTEFVDVAIRDGESIIKLAGFGNRLLQFKENTLYVIAVAGGEEYLEATYKNMGVRHPNAVTTLEEGVFWVNEFGAYIFTGQGPPINLIDNKIDLKDWSDFITNDSITGYFPREKKLIVIGDSSKIMDKREEDANRKEMYLYNVLTKSWNIQNLDMPIGDGDNSCANIVNYKDGIVHQLDGGSTDLPLNTDHTLFFAGKNAGSKSYFYEYVGQKDFSSLITLDTDLTTKDLTAGVPHQRKRLYGVYITYKGDSSKIGTAITQWDTKFPLVKFITKGIGTDEQTITLERVDNPPSEDDPPQYTGGKGFVDTNGEWRTAHYKVATADLSKANNVYSVKIKLDGKWHSTFEVNDMSLIFRIKTPK